MKVDTVSADDRRVVARFERWVESVRDRADRMSPGLYFRSLPEIVDWLFAAAKEPCEVEEDLRQREEENEVLYRRLDDGEASTMALVRAML